MLGQSSGMGFQQSYQPHVYNEPTWCLTKYSTFSGSKVNIDSGGLRVVFSMHRRQLTVWNENRIVICFDLNPVKTSIPTKEFYAIVKENNVSICRLKFRSIPDRVSFGAALSELVPVLVAKDKCASQDVSSQSWKTSSGTSSSQSDPSSHGTSEPGIGHTGGGYNWNGNSPLNNFTPPYTPSQPIVGTQSGSQSWKMTPPSSQTASQQFKNLMQPHEMNSQSGELRMERSGWSTPLKRPVENGRDGRDMAMKRKKKDEPFHTNLWETSFSSPYSDSDSLNDSFSSCSSQKSEFSSQPMSQPILPMRVDASTECGIEKSEMSTQTDSPSYPEEEEEVSTLLKKLLDHPEFVSFTNLLSYHIDGDEELLAIVDKNFVMNGGEEEEDGDKTQPLVEEEEGDKEGTDESGNESDHSDIIDL